MSQILYANFNGENRENHVCANTTCWRDATLAGTRDTTRDNAHEDMTGGSNYILSTGHSGTDAQAGRTGDATLVDLHDQLRELLRHEARGRAMDAFVADLRTNAKIEYR